MALDHDLGDIKQNTGDKQKMELKQALAELRKLEKRKFEQSIDLLISLKEIDPKKDNIATIVNIPNKIKDKKVCGFLTKKSDLVRTITNLDFPKYRDKKVLKKLVKEFDFFIAAAPLMPAVATTFGKVLGPAGKMPSPQIGMLPNEDEKTIKALLERIDKSMKIRVKEAAVKVSVAKESMPDEKIIENIEAVYRGVVSALPIKKDNVKKAMIKLTMSKPIIVEIK
jgi:large subunit ribosomal protein L1